MHFWGSIWSGSHLVVILSNLVPVKWKKHMFPIARLASGPLANLAMGNMCFFHFTGTKLLKITTTNQFPPWDVIELSVQRDVHKASS